MFPIPASISFLISALALPVLGVPLIMWALHLSPREIGWRWDGWRTPAFGVAWAGVLGVLEVGWLRVLLQTGDYLPIPIAPSLYEWLLLALALPIAEEVFFRGVVVGRLQRRWRPLWAVLLSAFIYLAAHAVDPMLAFVFLNGLGLALAFRQSASIAAPMLAHILLVTALLTARVYPAATAHLPLSVLGAVLLCAILLIALAKRHPTEKPPVIIRTITP